MDALPLLHLGFLLLALAALCPNSVLYIDDSAEGTKDSSSGKIMVTFYYCKDCDSSTFQCLPDISKIAEIEKMTVLDVISEATNKTHIHVCFKPEGSSHGGIFVINPKTAGGAGLSCSILNSREIERGNIGTGEHMVCCEVEKDTWNSNNAIQCHQAKTDNAEFLANQKTSICFAFLLIGITVIMSIMHCY